MCLHLFLVALPPVGSKHIWLQASGLNMVVKAGSTSVLLRDALRRPLAELELGGVKAGLRSLPKGVTQVLYPVYAVYAYKHVQQGSRALGL